jgi:hypothetical protein
MSEAQLLKLQKTFQEDMEGFEKRLSKFDFLQCDEFVKLRSDFERFIGTTEGTINGLLEDVRRLERQVDDLEAAEKSNALLLHGLKEGADAKLEDDVVNFINTKVSECVVTSSIAAVYRLGKINGERPRPVVVRFDSLRARNAVLKGRTKLKGTKCLITEFLTARRLHIFKEARKLVGLDSWAASGRVFVKIKNKVYTINNMRDLDAHRKDVKSNVGKPAVNTVSRERQLRPRKP